MISRVSVIFSLAPKYKHNIDVALVCIFRHIISLQPSVIVGLFDLNTSVPPVESLTPYIYAQLSMLTVDPRQCESH